MQQVLINFKPTIKAIFNFKIGYFYWTSEDLNLAGILLTS